MGTAKAENRNSHVSTQHYMGLPLGGLYHFTEDEGASSCIGRINRWATGPDGLERFVRSWYQLDPIGGGRVAEFGLGGSGIWCLPENVPVRYPLLPRLSFSLTEKQISTPGDQPSGRCKSVTRRKQCPPGIEPGALFLAIDRGRRSRKQAPSRGLGVFSVVDVWTTARYRCPICGERPDLKALGRTLCADCGWMGSAPEADTLTPAELELEGFPNLSADEFWKLLVKSGNVAEGGTVCRIAFAAAA